MKKIIVMLMAMCMLVSFTACTEQENAPDGMKNIARESDPFYFYVPKSWGESSGNVVGAYYSNADRSNISIMAYGGDFATVEEYWNDFKNRATAEFAEFETVKETEVRTIDGRNALGYTYKMKVDGTKYQCMQIAFSYGNLLYVITYTTTEEKYESHISEIEAIISEFKFK